MAVSVAGTVAVHLARLPTGARGYYNRGVADARAGRLASAIANLDRALQLDPSRADARVARAAAWVRADRPYLALRDADAALELAPESSRGLYVRGLALRRIGRDDEALDSFDRAATHDGGFGKAVLARGNAWFDRGCYAAALEDYRRAYLLRRRDDALAVAPILIWASRHLGGEAAGAAPSDGDAAVAAWIEAVKALAGGDRALAIERLRGAIATAPADSWVRERAWSALETQTLGLRVQPDNQEISESLSFGPGITVASVRDAGSAAAAGLLAGDRILRCDGKAASAARIADVVTGAPVGAAVTLEVARRGEPLTATLFVGVAGPLRPGACAPTK